MSIHGTALSPRGRQIDYEHLFACRKSGKPHAQVFMARDRLRRKAGVIHPGLQEFHHQFVSYPVNSGWAPCELQKIPVQANPTVMQRYTQLSTESLQDVAVCNFSWSVLIWYQENDISSLM
jgi:hypothetical protein